MKNIYLLIVLLILGVVANFIYQPPKYFMFDGPFKLEAEIKGEKTQVDAYLTWKQNAFALWNSIYFFPTSKELVYYNSENKLEWSIKEEAQERMEEEYKDKFTIPPWKYFMGSITILVIVILYFLIDIPILMIRDRKRWKTAREEDSFISYKKYLEAPDWLKLFKSTAKAKAVEKIDEYILFYKFLTANSKQKGKSIVIRLLELLKNENKIIVNVDLNGKNQLEDVQTRNHRLINYYNKVAENLRNDPEKYGPYYKVQDPEKYIKEINNSVKLWNDQMNYNIKDPAPFFSSKENRKKEVLITKLIERVFLKIFPEKLIFFKYKHSNTKVSFDISYEVMNSGTIFNWSKENEVSPQERDNFVGIKFKWNVKVLFEDQLLAEHVLWSEPDSHFSVKDRTYKGLYKTMAVSSFINFSKQLLAFLGLQSNTDKVAKKESGSHKTLQKDLFMKFREEFLDDAEGNIEDLVSLDLALPFQSDIENYIGNISFETEKFLDTYLNLTEKGIDITEMGEGILDNIFGSIEA